MPPEFAPTVISNRDRQPTPLDSAKTQAAAPNLVLAKMQATERAFAERLAAEKAANERFVASRAATRPPVPSQTSLPALGNPNVGYILSAILGIGLVALLAWLFAAFLTPRGDRAAAPNSR